jgi:hypothetical protein
MSRDLTSLPRIRLTDIQPSFGDIELTDEHKLLGIVLNSKLTLNKHSTCFLLCVISVFIC